MDKIIRVKVSESQHRALRILAADRSQSMQDLATAALERSDVTHIAMSAPGTYTLRAARQTKGKT